MEDARLKCNGLNRTRILESAVEHSIGSTEILGSARIEEFREIHDYYRTRKQNPLKRMQSVISIACKRIRIFYTILTKGVDCDGQKMMSDIVKPETAMAHKRIEKQYIVVDLST